MTPLVMIPGMMCDARLFAPQIAAFSGGRTVQVADISGHDSVAALADAVLADAPPRFALLGLSMGAIVAMEMLARAPRRVERLALLDTNPKPESDAVARHRLPQIDRVLQGELAAVMRDQMKPGYLASGPRQAQVLDLTMDMALALGPDVFARQSRALMTRPDQQDTLRAARLPALVLCGREDRLCPVHRHELMAGLIDDATLEIIDSAGHLPTLEQPETTNAAIGRWLQA